MAPMPQRPNDQPEPGAQLRAAGALAGEAMGSIVDIAADAHRAVTDRVEAALPPPARPVVAVTRTIAGGAFRVVGSAHRRLPAAAADLVARSALADELTTAAAPAAERVLPVVNGLWGDRIARDHAPLAVPMALRVDGADLAPAAAAGAFPSGSPHLVVFLHGLVESERDWWPRSSQGQGWSFGDRLAEEHGVTPLYVRYNTGRRISANGEDLAALLDQLLGAWPVPVERVSLVGHSMGGLVACSALHAGHGAGMSWVPPARTVVTLGSPHLGAPLEKAAHVTDWTLRRAAESAPYARLLGARSTGIKDLRHGAIAAAQWADDDELWPAWLAEVPLVPGVTYYHVAGSITADARHPAGRLVGDGLVRRGSASGRGWTRRIPLAPENGVHLGGVHHLALLHHDDVYGHLRRWVVPDGSAAR